MKRKECILLLGIAMICGVIIAALIRQNMKTWLACSGFCLAWCAGLWKWGGMEARKSGSLKWAMALNAAIAALSDSHIIWAWLLS